MAQPDVGELDRGSFADGLQNSEALRYKFEVTLKSIFNAGVRRSFDEPCVVFYSEDSVLRQLVFPFHRAVSDIAVAAHDGAWEAWVAIITMKPYEANNEAICIDFRAFSGKYC